MQLRQSFLVFIFASVLMATPLAFGQLPDLSESDLNAPENQIQGKPGEPKTDVPPDSLSVGNQEEETGATPASAPKAPSAANKKAVPQKAQAPQPEPTAAPNTTTSVPLEEIPPPEASTETEPAEQTRPRPAVELDGENPDDQAGGQTAAAPATEDNDRSANVSINPEAGDEDDDGQAPHPRNKICNCQYKTTVPYSERRSTIGGFFGVGAGNFSPVNYQPDFNSLNFSDYYKTMSPNVEATIGLKFNFSLGSLSAQLAGSYFKASATDGGALTVFPIMAGLNFALDNLFKEPYVVPYVVIGMYSDVYNEAVGGQTVGGTSAFSEFYSVGLMFQLDALDEDAHNSGYADFGLENTFLYVEARSFLPASNDLPDFSTLLQFTGGIKIEF